MGKLIDYIWKISNSVETDYRNLSLLPVVIGYDGKDAYKIAPHLNSNSTNIKHVHASYGRHSDDIGSDSYRINFHSFEMYCPILLVYSLENINSEDIEEIYPFNKEDYKKESVCQDGPELEYFSLGNQVENIIKYIECIFGSNEAYLCGELKGMGSESVEISVIRNLYTTSLNPKVKTIYVDIKDFRLIDEKLECIILPERLQVVDEFMTLASRPNLKVIGYKTYTTLHPASYNYEVAKLLVEYLRGKGKL